MQPRDREDREGIEQSVSMRLDRRCFLLASAVLSTAGCHNLVNRSQSPDNLSTSLKNDLKQNNAGYVSEICRIYGANYLKIEGIGLAFGLADTGSNPKPGGQRDHLARELSSLDLEVDVNTLLAGKDTELVLLKGLIPPAAKAGDRFDIEVGTMRSTEATSIENGMVSKTRMFPVESVGRAVAKGNVMGYCEGRIWVDALFEPRRDQANFLHGYILGGGTVLEDRELGLQVAGAEASTKRAIHIARAINARFTYEDAAGRHGVARPKTDRFITLKVPREYRNNLGRYIDVVMNVVHSETANELLERMDQLEAKLVDPAHAELCSFRLEAIGKNGVPILKRVLKHESLEVRFYAAEALAYMGESDGLPILRMVAETEPAFRWAAITAISTLEGADSAKALTELLHASSSETRFGAFQALQNHSPHDALVQGQQLGDFTLYRIPSSTKQPMLHFSRTKRAEIVLFGDQQTVTEEFFFEDRGITVEGTQNGHVAITKRSPKGLQRMVVTNQVADIIESMHRADFSYGDILKAFQAAKTSGTVMARLAVNAQPKLGRTYVPGQFSNAEGESNSTKPISADAENSAKSYNQVSTGNKNGSDNSRDSQGEQPATTLKRMKSWFTGQNN